ncbi:hypothetical protein GLOIN_2v1033089 [Rhizophagus irregularis DAOM 181602=DAOM 197198]|nr:hypothetical protein GLOIN_2v1033089 [Rhizophagus irregularis DAOM 181602=DAOM 197198]
MTTNLAYFNAPPESWTIHGYYKFRKLQSDFSGVFRKENSWLNDNLKTIINNLESKFSHQKVKRAQELLHILKNQMSDANVAVFWKEVDHERELNIVRNEGRLQSVKVTTDGVLNAIRTTNEIHQHNLLSLLPAGYSPKIGLNSDEQNTKSDFSSEYTPSTLLDSSSEYTPSDESGEDDVILRTDLHQKESNCSSPAKPENTELNEKYSDESFDKNERTASLRKSQIIVIMP